jgi:hypothetical protein
VKRAWRQRTAATTHTCCRAGVLSPLGDSPPFGRQPLAHPRVRARRRLGPCPTISTHIPPFPGAG